MALTIDDCHAMVQRARARGKHLAVGHEFRLSSQWGEIKKIIDRGVIGDPRPHHISNGLYLTKLLDSISLPFLLVEERKTIERIPAAFKHCQAMNRPEVVIFSEAVLLGEA